MKTKAFILSMLFVFASGCNLAPRYKQPVLPVNENWGSEEMYSSQEEFSEDMASAKNFIKDARLKTLIETALSGNRSLRAQIADVEAARALYKIERANLLPNVYAGGSAGRAENPNGVLNDSFGLEVGLSSFEIDLFGKNRNLKDSALEKYLASAEASSSAKIALIAETITAWFTLASDLELLEIARETVKSAQVSADIANTRFNSGVSTKLDLYQAQTILYQSKADSENYASVVAQDINALELLTGQKVDKALLPESIFGAQQWIGDVNAGLSSEILLRRPDVKAAEHTLKSANADIGAARAAFFPSISLVGSAGLASGELSGLFSGGTSVWGYSGNINLPIFSGGRNAANLNYGKAKYQSHLAQYDKAVQTAFKEVKDALARKATINNQLAAQSDLLTVSKEAYELAQMRYEKGVETYLSVLESQRTYYNAKKAMALAILTKLSNRVSLFKALGGGQQAIENN